MWFVSDGEHTERVHSGDTDGSAMLIMLKYGWTDTEMWRMTVLWIMWMVMNKLKRHVQSLHKKNPQ